MCVHAHARAWISCQITTGIGTHRRGHCRASPRPPRSAHVPACPHRPPPAYVALPSPFPFSTAVFRLPSFSCPCHFLSASWGQRSAFVLYLFFSFLHDRCPPTFPRASCPHREQSGLLLNVRSCISIFKHPILGYSPPCVCSFWDRVWTPCPCVDPAGATDGWTVLCTPLFHTGPSFPPKAPGLPAPHVDRSKKPGSSDRGLPTLPGFPDRDEHFPGKHVPIVTFQSHKISQTIYLITGASVIIIIIITIIMNNNEFHL